MITGQLIKKYREKRNLTQLELAVKLNYDIPQFISLVENGHSKAPVEMCARAAKILKIPKKVIKNYLISDYKKEIEKGFKL